jgi:osmotically-inducible protein OsmY
MYSTLGLRKTLCESGTSNSAPTNGSSAFRLQVHSQAGRVRLEGSVRSEAERLLAVRLAEGVPGVREVANELKPPDTGT